MSKGISLPIGAAIGVLVGLFASTLNGSAYAASGCRRCTQSRIGPGTDWNYRIDQTTKQHCWYLKKVGGKSRPRPTSVAHATRSRVTRDVAATPSRAAPVEVAAPAENDSPVTSWLRRDVQRPDWLERADHRDARAGRKRSPTPAQAARRYGGAHGEQGRPRAAIARVAREATENKEVATPSDQQSEWQKWLLRGIPAVAGEAAHVQ